MNPLPGTVEKRVIVRSVEQLAALVLEQDRKLFEQAVLAWWSAHVARVCAQARVTWLDLET